MTTLKRLAKHYMAQPFEVTLETLARCNAKCSFCPYPTLERIGTKMPDELIYRVMDEMAEWKLPFGFVPFKVSEPLLDKRLFTILSYLNEHVPRAKTRLFTNGAALTWERAEELNSIDNLELWVSVHEPNADKYKEVLGIDQRHVAANLDALHGSDFRHPVRVLKVGEQNKQEFVAWVRERWPIYTPIVVFQSSWLGYTNPDVTEIPDTPCSRWFELSIMATGVVSLCCMDGKGEFPIGDINKQSLLEIYNAPAWRDRRERMISRKEIYPCSTCSY